MNKFLLSIVLTISLCTVASANVVNVGKVSVTKYNWTGSRTSSDKWPYIGCIALSRDIIRKHNLRFGDKIILPGLGKYIYDDKMPPQWSNRCDIYHGHNVKDARKFGRLKNIPMIVEKR